MANASHAYQEFQATEQEAAEGPADAANAGVGAFDMMCDDPELFFENHLHLANPASVQRKRQMQGRLAFVQDLWNDAERFDAIVASGRYLKLCNLTEWVSDYDERAWMRIRNEILASQRRTPAQSE